MSELGTVEHQLEILQQGSFKKPPPASVPTPTIDQVDQLTPDVQNDNDVTFSADPPQLLTVNGTLRAPALVFPSVKNKPSSDASIIDGAEALLTGVIQWLPLSPKSLKCILLMDMLCIFCIHQK
jgi:hypothetical protein